MILPDFRLDWEVIGGHARLTREEENPVNLSGDFFARRANLLTLGTRLYFFGYDKEIT